MRISNNKLTEMQTAMMAILITLSWSAFAQESQSSATDEATPAAEAATDAAPAAETEVDAAADASADAAAEPKTGAAEATAESSEPIDLTPVPVEEPPAPAPAPAPAERAPAPQPQARQVREPVETRPVLRQGITQNMSVPLYKSGVLGLAEPAARISVGNPDIADILILRSTQLYVLGKDLGSTNVILWDRNDRLIGTVAVEVTHDIESLKAKYYELLPDEEIKVYSSQRNIVLAGRVSSVTAMDAAIRVAEGYLAPAGTAVDAIQFEQEAQGDDEEDEGQIVNLMEIGGGQQVMLEVKVAEISRTELRSIEAQMNFISNSSRWSFGGVNGGASFPDLDAGTDFAENIINGSEGIIPLGSGLPFFGTNPGGPATDLFAPNDLTIADKGLFASYLSDDFLFNMALNAAKENGLARILAEPTLTTLTGQEAEFLSGGEFPIPVPQDFGRTTIEFKDFGVGLRFLPVVLDDGVINLKVNISVSELAQNNSVILQDEGASSAFFVPSLSKRSAQATYELRDGQTIGVAGLINENLREVISKFPGLGDLPVLGALFRSQDFIKGESELMILITPRLAKPIDPNSITLPTDSFVEPSDADFYLLGRMEGKAPAKSDEGGTESDYGHQVQ
jgi:pilus assembly protein CpaC